jgi:hypothetical protein
MPRSGKPQYNDTVGLSSHPLFYSGQAPGGSGKEGIPTGDLQDPIQCALLGGEDDLTDREICRTLCGCTLTDPFKIPGKKEKLDAEPQVS